MWTFGTWVEAQMQEAEERLGKDAKQHQKSLARQRAFDDCMGIDSATVPGRFADPAGRKRGR